MTCEPWVPLGEVAAAWGWSPIDVAVAAMLGRIRWIYTGRARITPGSAAKCGRTKWSFVATPPERPTALDIARATEPPPPAGGPGYVYFIRAGERGPIKIGYATSVAERIKSLQTGNPTRLTVLLAVKASPKDERHLHRRFKAHRLGGEWFKPAPVLRLVAAWSPPT